jgi:hypothetical protein
MNNDDFEKQLREQPLRTVPREWRSEILQAARSAAAHSQPSAFNPQPSSWWREFLFPWRWHLAGMGAAWVLIALLNTGQSSASSTVTAKQITPSPTQVLMALRENRRQLLELIGPTAMETAPASPSFIPRRRSELVSTSAVA